MSRREISPKNGRYFFDGGLNTKFEPSIIGDNESPDCLNVVFSNGAVATREGSAKVNSTAIGSFVCDGLYTRHTNTGGQTMIAFAGGSAYALAGAAFTAIASGTSVFTAGIRVAAVEYQQHLFIGNGGVIPYKYNGTDFTRHGVYPPTTTSTVASQSAGSLNGDYRYKVTYVNSQSVESDVGPISVTFAAANAVLRVSAIPVAPQSFGISARRIYRNPTAASGTYKLVTTINDNTTTTYDDAIADASLGDTAPTDNGVPPKYSVIAYHRDRLFCNDPANPNFVTYSDLNEPYTFSALNFRRFGDNTADIVRVIAVDGENLVIFGDRSIMLIYMPDTDDTNWVNVRVKSDFGCKSPFGVVKYKNGLLFPAIQENKFVGFAHLIGDIIAPSGTLLTVSAAGSELVSDKIEPDILSASSNDVAELSGFVYENLAYFSLPSATSSTENDKIFVFDFSISNLSKNTPYSWATWTGLYAAQFAEYSGDLYFGDGRANGFVRKLNAGVYNDDGAAINSYYWTKEFGGNKGDFNLHKDFRFANILVDLAGNYQMNFSARVDSDTAAGNTQVIDLDPGGSLWGTMIWGTDEWGGGFAQNEFRMDLGTMSGKRIQYKFDNQNTVDQRFKVHSLNFLSNIKGFR
jgi:hypothetical protein